MSHEKRKYQLQHLITQVDRLRNEATNLASEHADSLDRMEPLEQRSALNLLHYLAVRLVHMG